MSYATSAIITKGLTCGIGADRSICRKGIITSFFSLYCDAEQPQPQQNPVPGGSRPYAPGEIQNLYQPVDVSSMPYYIVPRDKEAAFFTKYKPVKIVLRLGEKTLEKEYIIPENRVKYVVKAFDILNKTKNTISITVSGIKKLTSNAIIAIKNITLLRK